jgi:hypothetical protein
MAQFCRVLPARHLSATDNVDDHPTTPNLPDLLRLGSPVGLKDEGGRAPVELAYHRQNLRVWRLANVCFSATANFVGSGVLGAIGVVTLTKAKHKRELLFASLPTLFAVHQFIEGFVWLGLDGILSPAVTHNMGAAFVLYAQGLLPFLLPLSMCCLSRP